VALLLWVGMVRHLPTVLWGASELRAEVLLFGLALALFNFIAYSQFAPLWAFDRYFFASFLGLLVASAVALGDIPHAWHLRAALSLSLLLPVAFFAVAGVHDYFRWNDARWRLVENALKNGVTAQTLEGGYEVNGWLQFERPQSGTLQCVGRCGCRYPYHYFMCVDDSFRVGMHLFPGYEEIERVQPNYWLAAGPPLLMSRRASAP
jgi:hypothetical protein